MASFVRNLHLSVRKLQLSAHLIFFYNTVGYGNRNYNVYGAANHGRDIVKVRPVYVINAKFHDVRVWH